MALKQATKDQLKALGFDADKLIEAIKAEAEIDYTVPDIVPISQSDLEARDNNNKDAGKKEGETAAKTTFIKEVAKRLNIEAKGERIGDLVNDIQQKINASDDTKLKELNDQIKLLQTDKSTLQNQLTSEQARAKQASFDSELISYFPANRSADLSDAERLALVKMNLAFEDVDGKPVVKRNGEVLRDKNSQSPLAVKQVITDLFTEKKWVGAASGGQGGRGGSDNPPSGGSAGIKNMTQAQEQWKKENPEGNVMSPEFTAYVGKIMKEDTAFDAYH